MSTNGPMGRMKTIAILLVVSLGTTMCAPTSTQAPEVTEPAAVTSAPLPATEAPRPVLRISAETGLTSLDPPNNPITMCNIVGSPIYETLAGRDEQYNLAPGLALSWKQVEPLAWELTLRQGVTFQDGTPFNAEAVVYNIERAVDKDRVTRAILFTPYLAGAEAVDEYTVRIKTVGNTAYLPYVLASPFLGMVSPTAVDKHGKDFGRNPVGTGPFKFVKWVENEYVEMTAYDDYWGGAPKLGGILWKLIPDESARAFALQAGEVDLISNPPPATVALFKEDPGYQVLISPANIVITLWINPSAPNLTDLRVRQAIQYSIDRGAIVSTILSNLAAPAYQPLGSAVFGMLPPDKIPTGGFYAYDPDKARQLLAEAGWEDTDGDGLVEKDGEKLTIVLQTMQGRYLRDRQIVEAAAAFMKEAGFDAKVVVEEATLVFSRRNAKDYDMSISSWAWEVGYPEPSFNMVFHSQGPDLGALTSSWLNPEGDKLIEQTLVEPSEDVRRDLYEQISLLIMGDAIMYPVNYKINIWAASSALEGFTVRPSELPANWNQVTLAGS